MKKAEAGKRSRKKGGDATARSSPAGGDGPVSAGAIALRKIAGSLQNKADAVNQRLREMREPDTVARQTIARWGDGTRRPAPPARRAMESLWGIPFAAWEDFGAATASASTAKTTTDVASRVRAWRTKGTRDDEQFYVAGCTELAALRAQLGRVKSGLSERSRALAAGGPYDVARARILLMAPGIAEVLPEPVGDALAPIRAALAELHGSVLARIDGSLDDHRMADIRRLHRLCLQAEGALAECSAPLLDVGLLESETIQRLVADVASALRPDPARRTDVATALRVAPRNPLCDRIADLLDKVRHLAWPTDRYRDDPVGFCRDVLGFDPWSRQVEFLESVRSHKQTSVRSGHKVGKTRTIAALALWHYCSWPNAKVVLMNCTGHQLEDQDWAELMSLYRHSGRCLECVRNDPRGPRPCPHSQVIDGRLLTSSHGGLKSGDRVIVGVTARMTDALGGYSGANLMLIVDEASSLEDAMAQATIGNTAAKDAKLVMCGNPIRQTGPFFDSSHRNQQWWHCMCISSEEAAAAKFPGCPHEGYCEQMEAQDERGKESPLYMMRVRGEHPHQAESSIFALDDIVMAQDLAKYDEMPAEGRLVISIDPAGSEGFGDETVFSVVRGRKVLEQKVGRGWSAEDHRDIVIRMLRQYASHNERTLCAVDAGGIGEKVVYALEYAAEYQHESIEVMKMYFGQEAQDWQQYDKVVDEASALLSKWLRAGGVFPPSPKLEQELELPIWHPVRRRRHEREVEVLSATRKDDMRRIIHRSPDRLDSLRIFAWVAYLRGCLAGVEAVRASGMAAEPGGRDPWLTQWQNEALSKTPMGQGGSCDPWAFFDQQKQGGGHYGPTPVRDE